MPFVALSAHEIERLLPMGACIDVMARALVDLEDGRLSQPLRSVLVPPGANGGMAWMPAHRSGAQAVFAIRTAAVSALATRLLARANARVLAIVGTGVQARKHLESIPLVRPIERVRIAGRTPERAQKFVSEVAKHLAFSIEAAENAEVAVRDADIVVTATSSATPVLARGWLAPGVHVNAVGASRPTHCELDVDTIADALLFTDRRESLEHEAGEYRLAVEQGRITHSHVRGELGELLTGKREGRTSDEQLTLFRSLGLAVEDLAAAEYVLAKATESGSGTVVQF